MNCQQVQPLVSALYDGEIASREVADHIRNCPVCRGRLESYARIGAEMRLLASITLEETPMRLPHLPLRRWRWGRSLTARVLVPRFALGIGVFVVLGLSVGLGWMRAQTGGLWFQFDLSNPETHERVGFLIRADDPMRSVFLSSGPHKRIAVQLKALEVQNGLVRLTARARAFEPVPGSQEDTNYQSAGLSEQVMDRILANINLQEFDYVPGRTLEIPVVGGGAVSLKGEVFTVRPSFSAQWFPVTPKPDEIVLSKGALVRGSEFLGIVHGSGSAQATNSSFGICVPSLGAFVFALKPFDGAVKGIAEFSQARFKIDGDEYMLFSATPITGGQQPREIWVYRAQNCPPAWKRTPRNPLMIGVGDVSNVLDALHK
jgi:hypothetical protein